MPNLTVQDVLDLIGESSHEFFTVRFRKRSTGQERTLNCRRMVRKHLKGGKAAYEFNERGLISVWSPKDVGKNGPNDAGYRTFPVESVIEIKAQGQVWKFEETSKNAA